MHQRRGTFFGDVEKMMAQALYDANQTDTEIGLHIGVSVNNIIHWRRELGLPENGTRSAEALHSAKALVAKHDANHTDTEILPTVPRRQGVPAAMPPLAAGTNVTVEPIGDNALEIGTGIGGRKLHVDLGELLTTRLLIQGNSGSGKSHLLRRLLEEASGIVQQIVIDPEGDFVSFEQFGHTIIDAGKVGIGRLGSIAAKARQHRASAVLNLEALDRDRQMEAAGVFLTALFEAPQAHWFPALVAVDEAQMFAPTANNGEDGDARKASLEAMTNLMCRGRKRGLAGIIATQRIAKLHKNVAAEASNFLIGRTFLDIDMERSADLIGIAKKEAMQFRALNKGEFLGLGPAIARQSVTVKVGECITAGKAGAQGLVPLPSMSAEQMQSLVLADDEEPSPAPLLRAVK